MANVEAPTTFMSNYQASRQNKREDKQDSEKSLYSIYDEKRKRENHKAKIDMDEETQRHRMTMNPLSESIELYKNKLSWGTLDSDINRHREKTRNDKEEGLLRENQMESNLDWDLYTRGQNIDEYGAGQRFTTEQKDAVDAKRTNSDTIQHNDQINKEAQQKLVGNELYRQGLASATENKEAENYDKIYNEIFGAHSREIGLKQVNNSLWNPLQMASEGYAQQGRDFESSKRRYAMQNRMFDLNDKSQEAVEHFTEIRNSYLQDLSNTDKPMTKEDYRRKVEAMNQIDKYLQTMKVPGSANLSGMLQGVNLNGGLE